MKKVISIALLLCLPITSYATNNHGHSFKQKFHSGTDFSVTASGGSTSEFGGSAYNKTNIWAGGQSNINARVNCDCNGRSFVAHNNGKFDFKGESYSNSHGHSSYAGGGWDFKGGYKSFATQTWKRW